MTPDRAASADRHPRRLFRYLWFALPLLLAVALYGYSIRLPFFLDDGLLFTMIRDYPGGTPGFRFWGGSPSFPYYRPAVFTLWEFNQIILGGRFDPLALHAWNVFAFGLSGTVVTLLVRRITRLALAGILAGLTFVLFPFNYNAVTWVASLFHVQMVLGVVAALWFGLMWMDSRRARLSLALCWLFTFVAVFSHENGVFTLPLLSVLIVLVYGPGGLLRARPWVALFPVLLIVATYGYLMFNLPRPGTVPELIIDQFPGSFALFLQGLVYPFAALLRLTTGADASTPLLLSLAAVVILPLIFWVGWRSPGRVLIATFGIIWYVLTSLPATLLLETEYVLGSWRLLLLSSVGAAIFWGAMLAEMWSRPEANHHRQRIKAAIAIGIGVLGLLVSLDFLGRRRDDALLQSSYTWALQDQIREHTSGDPLVINAPSFLASLDENRLFPTVGTGVMFMENYVNYAQQFWAQTGEDFPRIEAAAFYPVLTPPSNLVFAPYLTVSPDSPVTDHLLRATDIYVTTFTERAFYPVYVGGPGLPGSDIAIATFPGAGLILTEAEAELTSNTLVTLRTRWHVETPLPVRPVVDVRCDGVAVGLSTGAVWGGTHPFSVWKPGEIETDRREIPLIQAVTVDCLQILIGIFNEADGDSVPVFTPNSDTPLPDHRLPVALSSGT